MVMAAWGCTTAVERALPLFTEEPALATEGLERDLSAGTWAIYSDRPIDATTIYMFPPAGSEDIVVEPQPNGRSETVSRPSGEYFVTARFEVSNPGVHRIGFERAAGEKVLLGPPVFDVFSISGRAAALLVGGLIIMVAGMVLWYRRTRS